MRILPDGQFVWAADGLPVTLPAGRDALNSSPRAQAVEALIESRLKLSRHREALLQQAKERIAEAEREQIEPTAEVLQSILEPLVREGMVHQLRDPFFELRLTSRPEECEDAEYNRYWQSFRAAVPPNSRTGVAY